MPHIIIPDSDPYASFVAAGRQTAFPVPFPFFAAADVLVFVNGQQATSGYAVTGTAVDGGFSTGTVTFSTAPGAGARVTVTRETPIRRTSDIPYPSATLDIETLNIKIDRLVAMAQDAERRTGQALRMPDSDASLAILPDVTQRANKLVGFDGSGQPTVYPTTDRSADTVLATGVSTPRTMVARAGEVANVLDFGAQADCNGTAGNGFDNRNAFQLAANLAVATGLPLVIPAGCYRLSGSVNLFSQADTSLMNRRPDIIGAGSRGTILVFDNGAMPGFDIRGTAVEAPQTIAQQHVRGFAMMKADLTGVALDLSGLSHTHVSDVLVYQWQYGIRCVDVQQAYWENIVAIFNSYGFLARRGTFTQPNNYLFSNCKFSGNQNSGLDVQNGAVVFWSGGSIESNGGPGLDVAKFGARILVDSGTVVEQNLAATFTGAYFERNAGAGDIYFASSTPAAPSGIAIFGCNFNRGLNSLGGSPVAGTNCVRIETSNSSLNTVSIVGCAFGGLPRSGGTGVQWVPSAATPYIGIVNAAQPLRLVMLNNRYTDAVEAPGVFDSGIWAAAQFNGITGAVARGQNVVGLNRNGAGDYTITFNYASAGGPYHWTASADLRSAWRLISYTTATIRVVFENASGVATDVSNASIMIWN